MNSQHTIGLYLSFHRFKTGRVFLAITWKQLNAKTWQTYDFYRRSLLSSAAGKIPVFNSPKSSIGGACILNYR